MSIRKNIRETLINQVTKILLHFSFQLTSGNFSNWLLIPSNWFVKLLKNLSDQPVTFWNQLWILMKLKEVGWRQKELKVSRRDHSWPRGTVRPTEAISAHSKSELDEMSILIAFLKLEIIYLKQKDYFSSRVLIDCMLGSRPWSLSLLILRWPRSHVLEDLYPPPKIFVDPTKYYFNNYL